MDKKIKAKRWDSYAIGKLLAKIFVLLLIIIFIVYPLIILIPEVINDSYRATIYFDNGYTDSFDIFIDGKEVGTVQSDSFIIKKWISPKKHKITVKRADNKEVFESLSVECEKGYKKTYIYNIGAKNNYTVTDYAYSSYNIYPEPDPPKNIDNERFFDITFIDCKLGEELPSSVRTSTGYATVDAIRRR